MALDQPVQLRPFGRLAAVVAGWFLVMSSLAVAADESDLDLIGDDDEEVFFQPTIATEGAGYIALPALDEVAPPPPASEPVLPPAKLLRLTVPAQKMTIRRDPRPNRMVGNDPESHRTILSIQEELEQSQQNNPLPNSVGIRPLEIGWVDDMPYGKYIFIPHKPLLFEDIPAERYGEVCYPCLEPGVSFVKFFGAIPMAPFKLTADCWAAKHDDAYTAYDHQGNLRPGILEGSYFPDCHVLKDHLCAAVAGTVVELATFGGIVVFLP
ncbi:MAG: hypothetical protein U0872_13460 [Planctomycetaceae bacterium]